MVNGPTPYPDVNETLNRLCAKVTALLGKQFVGMYLYGSLSSGDFNPESSDIDFVVVTESVLSPERIAALERLHQALWASGSKWAAKLEGSYLPKALMRRHDPHGPACPIVNEGHFYVGRHGSDWMIQRQVIREGVVVRGPNPKTLIDPVSANDIRAAIRGILREWWFPMLDDAAWLREHGSAYHAFAVLTMCRALYGLRYGRILSKPAAARWAQSEFGDQWRMLIQKALAAQSGAQAGFLDETLRLIRFTREQSG